MVPIPSGRDPDQVWSGSNPAEREFLLQYAQPRAGRYVAADISQDISPFFSFKGIMTESTPGVWVLSNQNRGDMLAADVPWARPGYRYRNFGSAPDDTTFSRPTTPVAQATSGSGEGITQQQVVNEILSVKGGLENLVAHLTSRQRLEDESRERSEAAISTLRAELSALRKRESASPVPQPPAGPSIGRAGSALSLAPPIVLGSPSALPAPAASLGSTSLRTSVLSSDKAEAIADRAIEAFSRTEEEKNPLWSTHKIPTWEAAFSTEARATLMLMPEHFVVKKCQLAEELKRALCRVAENFAALSAGVEACVRAWGQAMENRDRALSVSEAAALQFALQQALAHPLDHWPRLIIAELMLLSDKSGLAALIPRLRLARISRSEKDLVDKGLRVPCAADLLGVPVCTSGGAKKKQTNSQAEN